MNTVVVGWVGQHFSDVVSLSVHCHLMETLARKRRVRLFISDYGYNQNSQKREEVRIRQPSLVSIAFSMPPRIGSATLAGNPAGSD